MIYPSRHGSPMISRILDVAVVVSDGGKAGEWYRDKLGLRVGGEPEGHWVTVSPSGKEDDTYLHLCAGFYDLEPGNTGIAFATPDLQKAYEEMRGKGVEFTEEPTKEDWGFYAMFKDPDGNEFWLFEE